MDRMRRVATVIILLLVFYVPIGARALVSLPGDIFITELQTSGETASQEFIELYNNTGSDIDLSTYKLQFFSSTKVTINNFNWDPKTSGLTTISLSGKISSRGYFLISTAPGGQTYAPGLVDPDLTYSSGHMSDSGGGIQLVDVVGTGANQKFTVHDHVGWFKPTQILAMPTGFYLTPSAKGSLQRTLDANGAYPVPIDSDNSFISAVSTTPKEAWAAIEQEDDDSTDPVPVVDETGDSSAEPPTANPSTQTVEQNSPPPKPVIINELLPNPASPQTDNTDEFIELYNPNDQPVDLDGYVVQTGSNNTYSFTIHNQTITPGGYLVLTSGGTNLTLSNSGGQARLLDENGQVVSSSSSYGEAENGQAWALINNSWQWTTSPTPNAQNLLTNPVVEEKTLTKKAAVLTKKTAVPTKKSSKKAASTKAAKTSKASRTSKKPPVDPEESESAPPPLHTSTLAGVGALAVGYGAYEYRSDFANYYRKFRANRRIRRKLGA